MTNPTGIEMVLRSDTKFLGTLRSHRSRSLTAIVVALKTAVFVSPTLHPSSSHVSDYTAYSPDLFALACGTRAGGYHRRPGALLLHPSLLLTRDPVVLLNLSR